MPSWLTYTLLTMLLWGGWGVVSKPLSNALSSWQVQDLSMIGELPVIAFLFAARRAGNGPINRTALWLAFGSGALGSLGNVAYYQALAMGGKAAAVVQLTALHLPVTIVLALALLCERLNVIQWAGICTSLVAIYLFNVVNELGWFTPWFA